LGSEVGINAGTRAIRDRMKEEGFVDGIMKRREGISKNLATKRVE
jgi:hypothetical protein